MLAFKRLGPEWHALICPLPPWQGLISIIWLPSTRKSEKMFVCSLYALSVSTAPKAVGPQWLEMTPPT